MRVRRAAEPARRGAGRTPGGEGPHNNHPAHPRAAKFSVRRSEFDPSWPIIRLLAAARLLVILGPPVTWTGDAARRSTPQY